MSSLETKLSDLIKKIEQGAYPAKELVDKNAEDLQKKIASDIGCNDPAEAMALLGYLLKYNYVKIEPAKGICTNECERANIDLLRNL